ncbi:MAG: substrate-binding domain-containing protein, partial [Gemmataceae bacterium]|nr:substrate-binding domain-containing protein [Gemmataceae bacterium]
VLLGVVTLAALLSGLNRVAAEWRDTITGSLLIAVAIVNEFALRRAARLAIRQSRSSAQDASPHRRLVHPGDASMRRIIGILTICGLMVGCGSTSTPSGRPRVGFIPKLVGIPYFNACKRGAEEAAAEVGLDLVYNGPTETDVNKQIDLVRQWTASGEFDVICIACNEPDQIAPALRDAQRRGIPVITYDADTQPDARSFFVNQGTYDDVAREMVDSLAEQLSPPGEGVVGILTSSRQAPNQAEWAKRIRAYVAEKYPKLRLLEEAEHGEDRDRGITVAKAMIGANPDLKGIIGLTSVAVPAAAEAVRQSGKKGQIRVGGVSTPQDMRDYVKDGTVTEFVLWNPIDLGYLTVHVAHRQLKGEMPRTGTIRAGRLGEIKVRDGEVLLGKPMRFHKDNIDQFDF